MNKLFHSPLIISWELHEKEKEGSLKLGHGEVTLSLHNKGQKQRWNLKEPIRTSDSHIFPRDITHRITTTSFTAYSIQIKTIGAGSITDPAAQATSLPYKDCFPKVKVSSRRSKTTWSQNSPWTTGPTKPLQKSIRNSLLAPNDRETKVKS